MGGSSGLIDGGGHGYDDLMLSWSIVSLPDWTYNYTYTIILDNREAPAVSRAIVELSNECSPPSSPNYSQTACDSNPLVNGAPGVAILGNWCVGSNCLGNQLPGAPGGIEGIEFVDLPRSASSLTISFNTPGPPLWGDFYIAGGLQFAYNAGSANHLSPNILDFVAIPGYPGTTAPEPKTFGWLEQRSCCSVSWGSTAADKMQDSRDDRIGSCSSWSSLPARTLPVTLRFGGSRKVSDEAFVAFCRANPDLRCERTAGGEIVIVPPAGGESSHRSVDVPRFDGLGAT